MNVKKINLAVFQANIPSGWIASTFSDPNQLNIRLVIVNNLRKDYWIRIPYDIKETGNIQKIVMERFTDKLKELEEEDNAQNLKIKNQ